MKSLSALIFSLCLFSSAISQDNDGARPDRWRGLILAHGTPSDATHLLGEATKDYFGSVYASPIENWLSSQYRSGRNKKTFHNLDFNKPGEGADRVTLSFLNDKLAAIAIYPKQAKGAPAKEALPSIYGVPFEPVTHDMPIFQPGDSSRAPWVYPDCGISCIYGMVAVTPQSFILGDIVGGRLFRVTLISRSLELFAHPFWTAGPLQVRSFQQASRL